jgi:TPR repeat protein
MRTLSIIILLAALILPALAFAEIQAFTATHTYILGDHDSKDDARQRCLLEAKRKILEQAGVYIESASEVKNFDLTKDKITSFAAAVMQVKDTKEEVSFQQGHMTMTLKLIAQVDLAEVRKQLAARPIDAGVRDTVAAQQERLKRLEAQFEAMQKQQQVGQVPGRAPASPLSDISVADLRALHTQAAQGNATTQVELGLRYAVGNGVLQDYALARQLWEQAAAQGNATAQLNLGVLYGAGKGVPQDYATARQWWEQAAAQGDAMAQLKLGILYGNGWGVPQDYAMARQWYEQAAAQGNATAQLNLGYLYVKGKGVPQEYAKGRYWWEQAAARGNATAQFTLGVLYDNGEGVPKDDVRAYMWYSLAAANSTGEGQKVATENRDNVARLMTPAQIAEAQRLSQQCQAQQFKGC